jgi:hypothetical protein
MFQHYIKHKLPLTNSSVTGVCFLPQTCICNNVWRMDSFKNIPGILYFVDSSYFPDFLLFVALFISCSVLQWPADLHLSKAKITSTLYLWLQLHVIDRGLGLWDRIKIDNLTFYEQIEIYNIHICVLFPPLFMQKIVFNVVFSRFYWKIYI